MAATRWGFQLPAAGSNMDAFEASANVPREGFEFERRPVTGQSFENALAKARDGRRLERVHIRPCRRKLKTPPGSGHRNGKRCPGRPSPAG